MRASVKKASTIYWIKRYTTIFNLQTWWNETGVTSKNTNEFRWGTSDLLIWSGCPCSVYCKRTGMPMKLTTENSHSEQPPSQAKGGSGERAWKWHGNSEKKCNTQYLEKSMCNNVYTVTRLPALYWFRLPYIQKEKKDPSKLPHPTPPHSKKGPFKRSIKIPKLLAISKFRDSPKVTITWFLRIKKNNRHGKLK